MVEACRCIRKLGVAFFHQEVVKQTLVLAMEVPSSEPLMLKLLKEATEEGLISSSQVVKRFSRLADDLDDLRAPEYKSIFFKRLIRFSLDRKKIAFILPSQCL
ncbi:hypothetical protein RYX36_023588 [Vicia faba]